ncbi:MAG: Decaprenyl-phosphate phosphoribosyltransferase [Syntrophus sp. SKADARSKE-3]|nr:Decaprenyl-phosphate phosphoribosyltransferase [Syntrophus sp. SKADARSKE-3]
MSDYTNDDKYLPSHIKDYLKLLRAQDWVKNLVIFLPLFFSARIGEFIPFAKALTATVIFCLVSSAVYIFNDLQDLDVDRQHPKKIGRPLASGRIGKTPAMTIMITLLISGLSAAAYFSPMLLFYSSLYFLLNLVYSLKLKYVPIVDVVIIASGYVIRIFVGGSVTQTTIYMWIVVMTFLLAMFIGFAKRRDDVIICIEKGVEVRKVVERYNLRFIDASLIIMATVTIVSYIMYTVSSDTVAKFQTNKLYLTTVFVIIGILRYLQMIFVEKKGGFPTEILFTDTFMQLCIIGWFFTFGFIIYVKF